MAAQHKIAREISASYVGREIKVLVEGKADVKQLQAAKVSSWEHGLVRETGHPTLNGQTSKLSGCPRRSRRAGH